MHAMPEFTTVAELNAHYARVFQRRPKAPVPKPIQENPARSEQPHEKPAFEQLVGAGTCGATILDLPPAGEWLIGPPTKPHPPTMGQIQRATARHYRVSVQDINSGRHTADIVRPRQVAQYICKDLTLHSLPVIGRKFGNRDHTTILYAVRKIKNLATTDQKLADDIAAIRRLLGVADEAGGAQ